MRDKAQDPVIVIGMHRSGTTMLSGMLRELGVFMGERLEGNKEAYFFWHWNEWLMYQAGAGWDNPAGVKELMGRKRIRDEYAEYIRSSMNGLRSIKYLGLKRYREYRSIERITEPWGWKDPRNTFTLPIWLDLFPGAKVINVYRNGVDVAMSLFKRNEKSFVGSRRKRRLKSLLLPATSRLSVHMGLSPRCDDLGSAFGLWEEYVGEASEAVAGLGGRALDIRFEDFLEDPGTSLETVAGFCGLEVPKARIDGLVKGVRGERKFAFLGDAEAEVFYDSVRERPSMVGLGYSELLKSNGAGPARTSGAG